MCNGDGVKKGHPGFDIYLAAANTRARKHAAVHTCAADTRAVLHLGGHISANRTKYIEKAIEKQHECDKNRDLMWANTLCVADDSRTCCVVYTENNTPPTSHSMAKISVPKVQKAASSSSV